MSNLGDLKVSKSNLYLKLSQQNSEHELISVLQIISRELQLKGYFLDIEKENIIKICRKKRKELKENGMEKEWSKNVAMLFGNILKKIKKIEKLKVFYKNINILPKDGILQKFGQLNKEEYSEIRTISYNNIINNVKICKITTGGSSIFALSTEGEVYSCGNNLFGQLGHGNDTNIDVFKKITSLPKCKSVSSGYAFTSFLTIDGDVYVCGAGENGRLGTGNEDNLNIPTKLNIDFKVKAIECGSVHQVAISENNELYSWGEKMYNGHNESNDVLVPKKLDIFNGRYFQMISIGPGGYHTMALTVSGELFTWGHNRVGQLGLGNTTGNLEIDDSDHINTIPNLVSDVSHLNITYISAGWGNSAIVTEKGKLYICGRNCCGQLGILPTSCPKNKVDTEYISNFTEIKYFSGVHISKVICGGKHTAVISKDNRLFLFGSNMCGQLGTTQLLKDLYQSNCYYSWRAEEINIDEYNGNITDITLGSSSTYLLFKFN